MKLYEIPQEIENLVNEETGEITDPVLFTQLNENMEQKLSYLALINKNRESDVKALDDEIKALTERKKVLENKVNNTKAFLSSFMLENGIKKIETPRVVISFRKSTSVAIDDAVALLNDFKEKGLTDLYKTKVTESLDKTAIKKCLKDNMSNYCHLEEKQNIQIK